MNHNTQPQSEADDLELATRLFTMWRELPAASRMEYLTFVEAFEDPEQDPDQYRRIQELFRTLEHATSAA